MKIQIGFVIMLVSTLPGVLSAQPPTPGPELMVWQEGVNGNARWKLLGCPRNYESDADKHRMIAGGECKNANPDGTIKNENYRADERATWERLGCPHDFASDAEKEELIRRGLCRNAK